MTQVRRPRIDLPMAILIGAVALFAGVLAWRFLPMPRQAPPAAAAGSTTSPSPVDPIAQLEARTLQTPDDGEAWHALAAQYFDAGRYADAIAPYARAVSLLPKQAILWSALGEARLMASDHDPMPAEALADFRRAIAIDPKDPRARYFLAVARDLGGDHTGAIDDWLALLAATPPGAAWQADLRRTIEQVGRINAIDVDARIAAALPKGAPSPPVTALPGPTGGDLQAAAKLAPHEQQAMAEAMVARLEQRLQREPANLDGWLMLIRSRMTLGQPDAATAALGRAVAANPGDAAELRRQAALLGVR